MHDVVVDLGFGDAGKGTVVDHLCASKKRAAVVRFNGGCQAAHNVVCFDGTHHTFAQYGSGSFHGVPTFLSRFMLVEPLSMRIEAEAFEKASGRPAPEMYVDREALLTTPYHWEVNRARERARGAQRHGSCGRGIGETMAYALAYPEDAPRVGDAERPKVLKQKYAKLREWYLAETAHAPKQHSVPMAMSYTSDFLADQVRDWAYGNVNFVDRSFLFDLAQRGPLVFEGAQGVLLDEWRGFHPYTTWSTTTRANADTLLAEIGHEAHVRGVLRTFTTRHGAGPLPTEHPALELYQRLERHNQKDPWQGGFRVGWFDAVLHRYALECSPCDSLAVTHTDWPRHRVFRTCDGYRLTDKHTGQTDVLRRLAPREPAAYDMETLKYQEVMTNLVSMLEPVYEDREGDPVDIIQDLMNTKVTLTSSGPRTDQKQER